MFVAQPQWESTFPSLDSALVQSQRLATELSNGFERWLGASREMPVAHTEALGTEIDCTGDSDVPTPYAQAASFQAQLQRAVQVPSASTAYCPVTEHRTPTQAAYTIVPGGSRSSLQAFCAQGSACVAKPVQRQQSRSRICQGVQGQSLQKAPGMELSFPVVDQVPCVASTLGKSRLTYSCSSVVVDVSGPPRVELRQNREYASGSDHSSIAVVGGPGGNCGTSVKLLPRSFFSSQARLYRAAGAGSAESVTTAFREGSLSPSSNYSCASTTTPIGYAVQCRQEPSYPVMYDLRQVALPVTQAPTLTNVVSRKRLGCSSYPGADSLPYLSLDRSGYPLMKKPRVDVGRMDLVLTSRDVISQMGCQPVSDRSLVVHHHVNPLAAEPRLRCGLMPVQPIEDWSARLQVQLQIESPQTISLSWHIWQRVGNRGQFSWGMVQGSAIGVHDDQVILAIAMWISAKLEEHRKRVPTSQKVAKLLGVPTISVARLETAVMQLLDWSPYRGFLSL